MIYIIDCVEVKGGEREESFTFYYPFSYVTLQLHYSPKTKLTFITIRYAYHPIHSTN